MMEAAATDQFSRGLLRCHKPTFRSRAGRRRCPPSVRAEFLPVPALVTHVITSLPLSGVTIPRVVEGLSQGLFVRVMVEAGEHSHAQIRRARQSTL